MEGARSFQVTCSYVHNTSSHVVAQAVVQWRKAGNQTRLRLIQQRKKKKKEEKKRFAFSHINYLVPVHRIGEQMLVPAEDLGRGEGSTTARWWPDVFSNLQPKSSTLPPRQPETANKSLEYALWCIH